jgi:GTPase KRas
LVNYFISKCFIENENSKEKQRDFENLVIYQGKEFLLNLSIIEPSGETKFSDQSKTKIHEADGFLVTYDILQKSDLKEIENQIEQIRIIKDWEVLPIILVGTKCDLEEIRKISTEEEKKKADSFNAGFPFFEVSSKNGTNIEEVFMKLLEISKEFREFKPNPKKINMKICKTM